MLNNERYENILNLYGCVDAKYTSHDIRGLNIVVRVQKTFVGMHWPRLEQSPDRNLFIRCDVDDDGDEDFGKFTMNIFRRLCVKSVDFIFVLLLQRMLITRHNASAIMVIRQRLVMRTLMMIRRS